MPTDEFDLNSPSSVEVPTPTEENLSAETQSQSGLASSSARAAMEQVRESMRVAREARRQQLYFNNPRRADPPTVVASGYGNDYETYSDWYSAREREREVTPPLPSPTVDTGEITSGRTVLTGAGSVLMENGQVRLVGGQIVPAYRDYNPFVIRTSSEATKPQAKKEEIVKEPEIIGDFTEVKTQIYVQCFSIGGQKTKILFKRGDVLLKELEGNWKVEHKSFDELLVKECDRLQKAEEEKITGIIGSRPVPRKKKPVV